MTTTWCEAIYCPDCGKNLSNKIKIHFSKENKGVSFRVRKGQIEIWFFDALGGGELEILPYEGIIKCCGSY